MKKVLILVLLLIIGNFSKAQKLEVNAGGMVNAARLHYQKTNSSDIYFTSFGYSLQLPVKYIFCPLFAIQVNPGYALYSSFWEGIKDTRFYRFNNVTFPFYLNITIEERIGIYLGSDLNYLIGTKIKESRDVWSKTVFYDNHFLIGPSAGISYNFTSKFRVQFFYTYGFSSLVKEFYIVDENGMPVEKEKLLLNHMELGISYRIFTK